MAKIFFLLAIAAQLGAGSCEEANQETTKVYSDIDTDADSDSDSDSDADADYFMVGSGVARGETIAEGTSCNIVNLTHCCCDGNGLQTCQKDFTWSKCECYGEGGGGGISTFKSGSGDVVIPGNMVPDGNKNTKITFEWVETRPSPGECLAGKYVGTFDGIYQQTDIFKPSMFGNQGKVPIMGNVNMRLAQAANGEIFTVEDGDFDGFCLGFIPFRAKMSGKLNCSTKKFSGKILDGSYNLTGINFAPGIPRVNYFEGTLNASYDKMKHSFIKGKWEVSEPPPKEASGGNGTWTTAHR